MKKILVTGGSGYIGSVVVRQLLDMGYDVAIFDNLERGHRSFINNRARPYEGDLRDVGTIQRVSKAIRPDAVLHFATSALVDESMACPMLYFKNNVLGEVNLLAAMDEVGCKRIVFSSSCATYGVPKKLPIEEDMLQEPTSPYGH